MKCKQNYKIKKLHIKQTRNIVLLALTMEEIFMFFGMNNGCGGNHGGCGGDHGKGGFGGDCSCLILILLLCGCNGFGDGDCCWNIILILLLLNCCGCGNSIGKGY